MLKVLCKGLKDLIYPASCLICKNKMVAAKQEPVCADCLEKVEKNLPPFCSSCGRHMDQEAIQKNICSNCGREKFYFDHAFSPCRYTGLIKNLIREFKYSGKDYLGKPLGLLMNKFIIDYNLPITYFDYIVAVPLHKSKEREREFNQAEILSQQIAKEFNKEVLTKALVRNRPTKTQTEMNLGERIGNVENSFSIANPQLIKDRNLLLIDDVLTTGATANQAAKILKENGAKIVILLTLAN